MISDSLYSTVFLFTILIITVVSILRVSSTSYNLNDKPNKFLLYALTALVILYIGLRPNSELMGDTIRYTAYFDSVSKSLIEESRDYGFYTLMFFTKQIGLGVTSFYIIIAIIYVGCIAYACCIISPSYSIYTILVFLGSLSFYGYGVNALRNGSALSIFILGFSLFFYKNKYLAILIMLLSITFHSSLQLIVLLFIISILFKEYIKIFFVVWAVCFILSLTTDRYFENLFISLGLLGDKTDYLEGLTAGDNREFAIQGYRYDFALYGAIPVAYIFWNYVKRKCIFDDLYKSISIIYLSANAFWVLVNQNWLSNRFAYLSWAFYPIILIYPLTKNSKIHSRRLLRLILFLNVCFSIVMWMLDKYR